jgi:hypothetical protein
MAGGDFLDLFWKKRSCFQIISGWYNLLGLEKVKKKLLK